MTLATLSPIPASAQGALERLLVWDEVVQAGEDKALRWPIDVAAASANEVAVADIHGPRLIIFEKVAAGWSVAREVRLSGTPISVAHDGIRYAVSLRQSSGFFAVEGEQFQLRRISLSGKAVPGAVAGRVGGGFLVYDFTSDSVLVLDADGTESAIIEVNGHVTALAATPGGGFLAAVADRSEIRQYGANGDELQRWTVSGVSPVPAWPSGIAIAPGGELIVVDRHSGRLDVLDSSGRIEGIGSRAGWDPGLLWFPAGLALLPDGRVAVADQGNGRVQLFRRAPEAAAP
jgi:hypothetical protein